QPPQRKLFSFFNRDGEIHDAFVWIRRIVFEGRHWFGGVLDEALLPVKLLQVFKQALADFFAVGDVAFVQADDLADLRFGEDRIAFNFELAQPVNFSFNDGNRHAQTFVNRRKERQRQNRKTRASWSDALDARFAVSRLQVTLRAHVVVDQPQVILELLAIENVLAFE